MFCFPRIPARFGWLAMPMLLSILMTAVVSAVTTLSALGLSPRALGAWPMAWATSWLIALPTLLVLLPVVRRLAARLVAPPAP